MSAHQKWCKDGTSQVLNRVDGTCPFARENGRQFSYYSRALILSLQTSYAQNSLKFTVLNNSFKFSLFLQTNPSKCGLKFKRRFHVSLQKYFTD